VNLDKLTYAGNLANWPRSRTTPGTGSCRRHRRPGGRGGLLASHRPRAVVHFAAESHVDRSIHGRANSCRPTSWARSGFWRPRVATAVARGRRRTRSLPARVDGRGLRSLSETDPASPKPRPTRPTAPIASKAASDHLVRAYHHTYGLPVLTTNCSNNYGPSSSRKAGPPHDRQRAGGKPLPCTATPPGARLALRGHHCEPSARAGEGPPREVYNIGGSAEKAQPRGRPPICDSCRPAPRARAATAASSPTCRRPGHDRRYAIDARKIRASSAGRRASRSRRGSRARCAGTSTTRRGSAQVRSGEYRRWIEKNYEKRPRRCARNHPGRRLRHAALPVTQVVSKQLLPVYDKPWCTTRSPS